jgi:NAD-dependent DNA ligase
MVTVAQFAKAPVEYARKLDIADLVKILRKLSKLYYNTADSPLSDKMYDTVHEILAKRDPDNSFLKEIGSPVKQHKVSLPFPMGSLDKIKPDTNNLHSWVNTYNPPYILTDKLDGISALYCHMDDGHSLYTRGDGIVGQDITHILEYLDLNDIPKGFAIRGELIISIQNFEQIQDESKNARNAVAGIVNAKKPNPKIANLVEFVAYNVINPAMPQIKQLDMLRELDMNVVHHIVVNSITIDQLHKYFDTRRTQNKYEIDGIVVSDSGVHAIESGNPSHSFAFKSICDDQYTESTVLEVEWAVSRYGYLKPRVRIEPVTLVGVEITYATAHNAKYIYDNKIGPGSRIVVIRSGDVIPKIMDILSESTTGKPQMPSISFVWNDTHVDVLIAKDTKVTDDIILTKQLVNTFKVLGVKHIDEANASILVTAKLDSICTILDTKLSIIQELIGELTGVKLMDGLMSALENTQLHILMTASNCFGRGLGIKKLREIVLHYPNIMLEDWDDTQLYQKISSLDGFQEITTDKFIDGFACFKKYYQELNQYIDIDYLTKQKKTKVKQTLDGLKIVFTGFRDAKLEEYITTHGGIVSTSVSSKTDIVVCATVDDTSSKVTKAMELNIKIMTKAAFIKKYMS